MSNTNKKSEEEEAMHIRLTLQEKLRDLREERGLKLEELSKQIGISKSALSQYENDEGKEIGHKHIHLLLRENLSLYYGRRPGQGKRYTMPAFGQVGSLAILYCTNHISKQFNRIKSLDTGRESAHGETATAD